MQEEPLLRLVGILRSTIEQLEKDAVLKPDDPAVVELRGILLRRIADLGVALPITDESKVPGTTVISLEDVPTKSKRKGL